MPAVLRKIWPFNIASLIRFAPWIHDSTADEDVPTKREGGTCVRPGVSLTSSLARHDGQTCLPNETVV